MKRVKKIEKSEIHLDVNGFSIQIWNWWWCNIFYAIYSFALIPLHIWLWLSNRYTQREKHFAHSLFEHIICTVFFLSRVFVGFSSLYFTWKEINDLSSEVSVVFFPAKSRSKQTCNMNLDRILKSVCNVFHSQKQQHHILFVCMCVLFSFDPDWLFVRAYVLYFCVEELTWFSSVLWLIEQALKNQIEETQKQGTDWETYRLKYIKFESEWKHPVMDVRNDDEGKNCIHLSIGWQFWLVQ